MADLPREVQSMIACYLSDPDLCNYRLASRMLARIGARILFRTFAFRASGASVARLQDVSNNPQLSQHVQALIWDTNLWNLRLGKAWYTDNFGSWLERIRIGPAWDIGRYVDPHIQTGSRFTHELHTSTKEDLPWCFDHPLCEEQWSAWFQRNGEMVRPRFEQYKQRVTDEECALLHDLSYNGLSSNIAHLPKLEKVFIINGRFTYTPGGVRKTHYRCGPPKDSDWYSRGERLHATDDKDLCFVAGVLPFWSLLLAYGDGLKKLRIDALDLRAFCGDLERLGLRGNRPQYETPLTRLFEPTFDKLAYNCNFFVYPKHRKFHREFEIYPPIDINNNALRLCKHLTSLRLTITTADYFRDHSKTLLRWMGATLKNFLRGLPKLLSLSLSFEGHTPNPWNQTHLSFVVPQFAGEFVWTRFVLADPVLVWPSLRKLVLSFVRVNRHQLVMLETCRTTLKNLRLFQITLELVNEPGLQESETPNTWKETLGIFKLMFDDVHRVLDLEKATVGGLIRLTNPYIRNEMQHLMMDMAPASSLGSQTETLGMSLGRYLVHGGECPIAALETMRDLAYISTMHWQQYTPGEWSFYPYEVSDN
ncbi:hypothetical protein BU23DRAFT_286039 [Bimuria novae-zelandiae CBS 107.79]|uniref:F-box domain-containing protein n=1 Tax=Bimuria novae-zelandiae CBS 107.79 TaxID=1447943 RepID=A0A6A5USP4_9PLEO|nr:hypothetical protein BU23DRAFT_286039 [Bimuria novae-zelandiae CBS 107.79]